MAREKLSLKTNLPCRLAVKFADYFRHSEHGDSLKLTVKVAPGQEHYTEGEYSLFLHTALIGELVGAGILAEDGTDNRGLPAFKPKVKGALVALVTEEGKKKRTTFTVEGRPAPTVPATPTPAPGTSSAPAPAAAPAAAQVPGDPRRAWVELAHRYEHALAIASGALCRMYGIPVEQLEARAVTAAAATVFIEANRGYLPAGPESLRDVLFALTSEGEVPPASAPAPAPAPAKAATKPAPVHATAAGPGLEQPPEALEEDEDDGLPF